MDQLQGGIEVQSETRSCQSCQQSFEIAPEDFAFYSKMDVPAPTFCPACRVQRRLSFQNEWRLFKKADANGKEVFSAWSPSAPVKIYEPDYWHSDAWDPMQYGRDYDFSRPFFVQMKALLGEVPVLARAVSELENSDYVINANGMKNCYLANASGFSEDSAYLVWAFQARSCFDCHMITDCELCYGSVNLDKCYQTHFSVDCVSCRNVILSKDCVNCSDCFGCANLRNKQYHIFNKPYSKEEYEAKLQEFALGSWQNFQKLREQAHELWRAYPRKSTHGTSNEDSTGEYVYESKRATAMYRVRQMEDSKWCQNVLVGPGRDCYDYTNWAHGAELVYETIYAGEGVYNLKFCWYCWTNNRNLQYSMFCHNSSDLFGCIGLKNKQYCIFNKQYTKEEYDQLVPKIIEHMNQMTYVDALGREYRYGEFFPAELSPHEYNVTTAQEFFPATKAEVEARGGRWLERPAVERPIQLRSDQLPDDIAGASEELVGQVIACEHSGSCAHECTTAFTFMPQELAFLLEQKLPLPRTCPNCRHYERIAHRSGMLLSARRCSCQGGTSENGTYTNTASHQSHDAETACPNEFETAYPADAQTIVYCEACYQAEVS